MGTDKSIVLTGAASGIGRHLAKTLSAKGHRVLATDVNEQGLSDLAALRGRGGGGDLLTTPLDVTHPDQWENALDLAEKEFGVIDVVMNVAGYLKPGFVHELDERAVHLHIDVNVKGVLFGTRAAARRMVAQGQGHIVNFGSLASLAAVPGLCLYSASKYAVRGFSLAAAAELAPHNVAVTLVMPDAVQTPMLDLQVHYEEAAMTFSGDAPLTVEDIEAVISNEVLPNQPMEITVPLGRGLLARLANTAPGAALLLAPRLTAKGKKAQEKAKKNDL
ncbi:MAG: SDR family NAD(P)-dependent oxidoreductase [Polyangiaceae bacterium]